MIGRSGSYVPDRGEVIRIDFDPIRGHEQAGHRPAVVMSSRPQNARSGLVLVCPVTSRTKGYEFEVAIPPGLPVFGIVLCDQLRCLDWQARPPRFVCVLPGPVVAAVEAAVTRAIH